MLPACYASVAGITGYHRVLFINGTAELSKLHHFCDFFFKNFFFGACFPVRGDLI